MFVKRIAFEEEAASEMYRVTGVGIICVDTGDQEVRREVSVSNIASSSAVLCQDWTNSLHV